MARVSFPLIAQFKLKEKEKCKGEKDQRNESRMIESESEKHERCERTFGMFVMPLVCNCLK